jgi:hypothetical protein
MLKQPGVTRPKAAWLGMPDSEVAARAVAEDQLLREELETKFKQQVY